MMTALRRKGWNVADFCEKEYMPLRWRSRGMRAVGRIIRENSSREFNKAIVQQAELHPPDMFLVFKGRYVFAGTIKKLKKMGVKSYCVYPDVSFRVHGRHIPEALPCYDWVFTTKKFGLSDMRNQLGVTRSSLILHAADSHLHRPVPLDSRDMADFGCDVSFIGTWSVKKEALLTAVAKRMPNIKMKVFGNQWDRVSQISPLQNAIVDHAVYTLDYVKAIRASKINIAILSEARQGASSGDQITSRTFHIPASGGFMLHERTDEVLQVFQEGKHMACFENEEELIEKIDFYLADSKTRERIADQGNQEAMTMHTWDQRIDVVLEKHSQIM